MRKLDRNAVPSKEYRLREPHQQQEELRETQGLNSDGVATKPVPAAAAVPGILAMPKMSFAAPPLLLPDLRHNPIKNPVVTSLAPYAALSTPEPTPPTPASLQNPNCGNQKAHTQSVQ